MLLADPRRRRSNVHRLLRPTVGGTIHGLINEDVAATGALWTALVKRCGRISVDTGTVAGISAPRHIGPVRACGHPSIATSILAITGSAVEAPQHLRLNLANIFVIKEDAPVPTSHDSDVVASVDFSAYVHHHAPQFKKPSWRLFAGLCTVYVGGLSHDACGGRPTLARFPWWPMFHNSQLQRKHNSVRKATAASQALNIFETLEVQNQHRGQLVNSVPLLCFLQTTTRVAEELVASSQQFGRFKCSKTRSNGRVSLDVD
jgi:hypothetical protein